ncbi:ribulose-phosphate 3-epimerase [bacterium]|nr:ribulose-phosphate 3-epimerase [bacterium]
MRISPSILAADLADLSTCLKHLEGTGCDMVHFDIMDGHFVPNLTFGPPLVKAARRHTKLPFDVHLMVTNPADYVEPLTGLDIKLLSFQIEATRFAPRLISLIREHDMRPSVVLNPQTPLTAVEHVLPLVANVLIMSVDPGFAGQPFIEQMYAKIEQLNAYREENELVFTIQVDGGVNQNNIDELSAIGVDIVVAGKAFFTCPQPEEFVNRVQSLA